MAPSAAQTPVCVIDMAYDPNRRTTKVPAVNRVRAQDQDITVKDDLKRTKKFAEVLDKVADTVREEARKRSHQTYEDVALRQSSGLASRNSKKPR